jgi:hypothetical protein
VSHHTKVLIGGTGLWLVMVLAGVSALAAYKATPGTVGAAPPRWPATSSLSHTTEQATLVMFLHPRCPCSRASLDELAPVIAAHGEGLTVHLVFMGQPAPEPDSELWQKAQQLPGVHLDIDADGAERKRFGATTSGETVLYAANGTLLFHGGITASRGHVGDSLGKERLERLIAGLPADRADAPTFGCALNNPERRIARE